MVFKKGHRTNVGRKHTEEEIKKRTETRRKNGWFKNPKEHRRRISEANKGKTHGFKKDHIVPKRLREKISLRMKKDNPAKRPEVRKKISEKAKSRHIGEGNPNWKGGVSFEPYLPEFNNQLKRKIKNRDNNICQLCGDKINKNTKNRSLCVHHIDYNKQNNNPLNLITLCNFCNSSVNSSREQWTKFFQNRIENIK